MNATPPPEIDIVIVSFNTAPLLRQCLAAIRAHTRPGQVQVHVADNASADGSPDLVRQEFPEVRLLALDENIGFGAANNIAAADARGKHLLFLNPDAELTPGALDSLAQTIEQHPRAVIAGPRLVGPGGEPQLSCRQFPTPWRAAWSLSGLEARFGRRVPRWRNWLFPEEHDAPRAVDMVSGACFLVRRQYFEAVGGFDPELFLYEEEMDISIPAARTSQEIRYTPAAQVIHRGGAAVDAAGLAPFAARHMFRSKYRCFRKHYGPAAARRARFLDQLILGAARCRNLLLFRRRPEIAALHKHARRGWRDSFRSIAELREQGGFFDP